MFTHRSSKIFVGLLVISAALAVAGFAIHPVPAPVADRSYDRLEQIRADRSAAYSADDVIDRVRAQRGATLVADSSYDLIEQVRIGRSSSPSADRSYDEIEAVRLQR